MGCVQQQEVEAALTPELLKILTQTRNRLCEVTKTTQQVLDVAFWGERLQNTGQPSICTSIQDLAFQAIFDYVQQQEVEAALTPELLKTLTEKLHQHNDQSGSVIAPTHKPPTPSLLAAQFQILTNQLLAADAVYQEQGLRMERRGGRITAFREGNSVQHQANEIVKLNQGNYHKAGLSVEITGSFIEIQLDQNLVFKSNQGKVERPDDLLLMSNLELQLQSTITLLQQTIEAQQQQARLEALRLKAQTKTTNTSTIKTQPKERGHGFTL